MQIRKAERKDVPLILSFIRGIAKYEKLENEVQATEELLDEWLFQKGIAEVVFAVEDGVETGFALFFHNYSTFTGRAGIYLEDLYVKPEYRGKGYGTKGLALTLEVARTIVPEDEFYLRVNRDNPASLKVMQKNGGRIVKGDDEHYYVRIKK